MLAKKKKKKKKAEFWHLEKAQRRFEVTEARLVALAGGHEGSRAESNLSKMLHDISSPHKHRRFPKLGVCFGGPPAKDSSQL